METINYTITGTLPLIMHNGRMANPLDEYTKALKKISGKRKKTDEDYEALATIEARAGLYWDEQHGYHIPGENIERMLLDGAKLRKLGTTFKRALRVIDINCPITTDAPSDPDKLARDPKYLYVKQVKVGTSRVVRTRPIFPDWALSFTVAYVPEQIDSESITTVLNDCSTLIGLGDFRPRFGLFDIKETK